MGMFGKVVVLFMLVLLALIVANLIQTSNELKESPISTRNITLYGNISGRVFNAELNFRGDELESGIYKEGEYSCYYLPEMGIWTEGMGKECDSVFRLPKTLEEVNSAVEEGRYAPSTKCPSDMVCIIFR